MPLPKGRHIVRDFVPEPREKQFGYSAGFSGGAPGGGKTQVAKGLGSYLGGQGPGGWASNHYRESTNLIGSAFCAVRAIARTCARAERKVFKTGAGARSRIDRVTKGWKRGRVPTALYREFLKSITAAADGDDAVPVDQNHPLKRLIDRPNPYMSASQFLFQYAQQASVTGTALLWTRRDNYKEFDERGAPRRAYIIPTGLAVPLIPDRDSPRGAYRVQPVGSYGGSVGVEDDTMGDAQWGTLMLSGGVIDGRQVRPVRWPHPLFLTDGLSPMAAGELWIDIASQLDRATWYGFKNTMKPGMIFGMDAGAEEPTPDEADRFDASLQANVAGLDALGKHLRLPKGVTLLDKERSVNELDYANGRQIIQRDVLSLWATPPVAVGLQEAGAFAAYWASLLQFSEQAVEPVLHLLSDDVTHEWAPAFGDDLEVRFTPPTINNVDQKMAELALDVQAKAITINEYRKQRGLDPMPEPYGSMQIGKDIPSPWEMQAIEQDQKKSDLDIQQGGQQLAAGNAENPDEGVDSGGSGGDNAREKQLRTRRRTRSRRLEVPGYFPVAPLYIPSAVVNGKDTLTR